MINNVWKLDYIYIYMRDIIKFVHDDCVLINNKVFVCEKLDLCLKLYQIICFHF